MNLLPCSICGRPPVISIEQFGTIIYCENECYELYDGEAGRWFQTFPWTDKDEAIEEWNQAVKCNNGIRQIKLKL